MQSWQHVVAPCLAGPEVRDITERFCLADVCPVPAPPYVGLSLKAALDPLAVATRGSVFSPTTQRPCVR